MGTYVVILALSADGDASQIVGPFADFDAADAWGSHSAPTRTHDGWPIQWHVEELTPPADAGDL